MSTPKKWNRRAKRRTDVDDEIPAISENELTPEFDFKRVRPKKRKDRHQGYTVIPEYRLWIFENNP